MALGAIGCSFSISFQILLPVAPVLTERNGPYGAAGAATAALFIGAVIGEFLTPWLMLLGSPARLMILLALFVGFVLVSCSFGGVITYAPIVLPLDGFGSAAMFLLVSGASRTASRWLSGVIGDYQPARLILVSGVGLSAAGLVALATRGGPIAIMIAAAAYGTGYGAVQTGAYLAMTARGGSYSSSASSALWNIAIDLGGSVGGILIGLSAALYGYLNAVWAMPAVLLMSLPLFWWSRKLSSFPFASDP